MARWEQMVDRFVGREGETALGGVAHAQAHQQAGRQAGATRREPMDTGGVGWRGLGDGKRQGKGRQRAGTMLPQQRLPILLGFRPRARVVQVG